MRNKAHNVLAGFLQHGAILEGPKARLALIAAIAGVGAVILAPGANNDAAASAEPSAYSQMIADRQGELADLSADTRVFILDRSADKTAELKRISAASGVSLEALEQAAPDGVAFSTELSADVCLVAGPQPDIKAADILSVGGFTPANPGAVSDFDIQRWQIDVQVARCMPNYDDGKAAAYAAFRAYSDDPSSELVPLMIATTELQALTGQVRPSVPNTLRQVRDLLDQPRFAALLDAGTATPSGMMALAGADYGEVDSGMTRAVGQAFGFALDKEAFYVPTSDGFVIADLQTWLESATPIPEVSRMMELQQYLSGEPGERMLPGAYMLDLVTSRAEVARLALAGDPVARTIAPSFGDATRYQLMPIETDRYLPDSADVAGTAVPVNRATPTLVRFERHGKGIELVDGDLQPVVSATSDGNVTVHAEGQGDYSAQRTASL